MQQQGRRVLAMLREDRQAHAASDIHLHGLIPIPQQARLCHMPQHLLRECLGLRHAVQVCQQQHELVTAQPAHRVRRPQ